ncbi:hypothetical protein D3C75_779300 [compost metagenome]
MICSHYQQIVLKSERILHYHACSCLYIAFTLMGDVAVLSKRFQAVFHLKGDLVDRFLDVGLYLMRQSKRLSYRIAVRDILLFAIRLKNTKRYIVFAFPGCKLVRSPFAQTRGNRTVYSSADCNQQTARPCFQHICFQKIHPFPDLCLHINGGLNTKGGNDFVLHTQVRTPRFTVYLRLFYL